MGILRREKRRYNAHFVFYKPIKISPLTFAAPSTFSVRIARLSSAQANIRNPNLYAHTRVRTKYPKKIAKHFAKNRLTINDDGNIFMHGKKVSKI